MAENIAAEVLRPIIEATVKSVGATMKRQFNYLCCFTSNIATLKDEAQKLDDETKGLQQQVDRERENVQIIVPAVETWLKKSNHMKDLKKTILDEVPNVESGCLKLRARFSLSKRAKKTADHMEELRGQCKFDVISQPGPSAAMEAVPLGTTFDFKSRKQIEEDIMKSLRDGKMNMIGICGMGGLGKTTMAKMIMNWALKDQIVDEVVMAVVSQPVDKLKIQLEIGGPLGLKNLKEETPLANRVQMLHTRLTACTKRVLLVLDDVWERLVMEELGIPRDCKDCTILLTSRNQDVLRAMNVEKVFGMEVLTKEDAWFLFREIAGTCVDDIGLNSIAKEVVEECKGLPIALSTVGAALKDEKNKGIWKDAVRQLRKANPTIIPYFIKDVYKPLKVSYDKLESQQAKSVFLLCCLFGEDADIRLNYLTYFCMGLGIFEGDISNLEESRNRMSVLIKILKSRSLLLDSKYGNHWVQMHDVVRDVCIFIAKEKGYIGGNDCTWISSFQTTAGERIKLPINLRLLFLSHNYSKEDEEINKFNDCYVEGIRDLQVLFIENHSSLTSLPHTTESLRNLKTLVLISCPKLETISFVGELVHLEILSCGGCRSIKELPPEMKRLNRLKLLDLSWCRNLERIGGGIISSLVGLEELKMYGSFKKWDSNERENGNATVRELEALTNLRCLEIDIDDPALAAQNMRLSSKLDRFRIRIPPSKYEFLPYSFNKEISLKWEGETCVGEWIEKQLIRDAECLCLTGNGANNVDYMAKSQNIRWLKLKECETMKNIGRTSTDDATVFPHMEYLELDSLPQLEEILDGPISSNSFHNLEKLELTRLPALKQLWKSSSSPVFTNLSSIRIVNCPKLEEILDGPISSNSFHNLKELTLEDLPALKQLWKSSSSPVFHNLSSIEIWNCPCLRNLGQLSSIAENNCLSQLQTLQISNCVMMEQVFLWNEEDERRITKIMFPKLKKVELDNLPNLVTLCQGIGSIEFPLLMEMRMDNLPNLVTLCQGIGSIEFPLLTKMAIQRCPKMKSMVSSEENNCGGSRNADIDDYHSPHLFCQPQNVSFDSLKILAVEGNAFYCQKIPISFFYGLEELTVCGCKGSMSLFTSLIAQIFMNLRELSIRKCYEIVKVIKDEEEEKAASGGERPLLFRKLEKLNLQDLPALKQLWKSSSSPVFHNLSSISISNCPKLEEILDGPISSNSFHNLSSIYIVRCHCLCNLGQLSSIAQNNCLSQLQTLEIYNCEMMEQVFLWNEEDGRRITKIMFPKLKEVELSNLPNLVTLCQGIGSIEFPLLTTMRMEECPKMKSIVSSKESKPGGSSSSADIDDDYSSHLFCQPRKVSFGSLQKLFTDQNSFCGHEILVSSFNGLETLEIFGYKGKMSLFTSSIARNFVSLKILSIRKCDEMVQVIQDEEEKTVSGGQKTIAFPNLQELELRDSRKLVRFCKWKFDIELPSLSQVIIVKCPMMTNLASKQRLSAIAQLQFLHIEECEMMEQVFLWKEEDNQRNIDTTLAFSELTSLSLKSLPKLTSLCKGIESFEFPQLTQIQVKDCPLLMDKVFSMNLFLEPDKVKMDIWNNQPFRNAEYLSLEGNACRNLDFRVVQNMHLLTLRECSMGKKLVNMTTMDTHFPHLEVLRLVKLTELEEIWDIDAPIQSHSFKNLKELRFEFLPKLKHLWQGSSSPSEMTVVSIFSKLSSLYIYGCHDLCNLLSVTFTSSCLLEELVIESCDRMEQVFIWNEGETQSNIRIPKLKILILDSLPKLTSFCKGTESFEFPLLNRKRISRCPLLKNFVCTDWSPEDHDDSDDDYTHLFCKPDNKENMKLKLQGNMSLGRSRIQECVEYMSLEGDGSTSLDFGVAQSMRCLTLREFSMNLATITTLFPLLEVLCLVNITELEEIWDIDGPTNINELRLKSLPALKHLWQIRSSSSQMNVDVSIFNKLSCIYIYGCHRLCNLFPLSMMGKGSCLLQLETLVIESCDEMEQLFSCNEEDNERNIDTTLVFPELKSLSLKCLPKLTSLCIGIESFEFPRLTQIQLKDCPLLNEKVFPMNLFYEPDKVKIEIWNNQPFRNAEYLSLEGNAYRNLDVRKVQNMRWLIFRECVRGTKLVSVTTMDTLFPRLEVLRLLKLTELEEIWDIDGPNSFQNLKELRLEFLPALKHLWPSEVVSIFNKLSCIYIYGCHKLRNLFSLPVTETDSYLLQLEELVIESCDMIEYLFFWNEGENQSNIHIPKLKVLILDSLPKLTSFCKGTKKIEFPLLDLKRISRCPLLENFVSTDWPPDDHGHNIHLFCEPDNVLTKVEQKMELKLQGNITLARNKIQECVEYMSFERDGSTSSDFGVGESMRCLTFRECSMGTKLMNMTTIATLFPLIKVLTLRECSMGTKLMNMTTIATPFPVLENLCLVNITELEEIWDIDGPKNINELRLKSLPALKHLWQIRSSTPSQMNAVPSFSKLSSIYIYGCHELCNLFSLSVMATGSCLLQLENLAIESCEMLERVFLWNEEESQRSIELPKLKVLKLDSLPRLMSFCEGTESFEFPLLVEMRISRCPLLQNLVSTNQSPIDHDHDSMHLFCKRDKVSFGSLKVLSTARNPFCGHKILVSSFNGLVELRIIEYRSCTSIFSSSIARNLLSLRVLDISKCDEMVQVIQDEEEEEEKVNAGDQITLLFPKLENLALRDLCKLEAFCEWKSDVELPSLIQVVIVRCPKMKNFTRGKDCISKLEILNIEECEMMEEVYLWNDEDQQSDIDTTLVFSELKSLSLKSLRKLSSLCKGIESFEFPMLTQIQVEDCPVLLQNVVSINLFSKSNKAKMEKLMKNQPFRNAEYLSVEGDSYRNLDCKEVHQNMHWMTFRESSMGTKLVNLTAMDTLFPRLEVLRVVKLTELEEIWVIDSPIPSNSFQNLKELRLEFLPAMKHLWLSSSPSQMNVVSIFNKLSCLHIYGCHDLCNLYSLPVTEMNSCLLLLEELVIESCDRMEHVFLFNEGENQSIIHIPNLKVLILDSLPKLTSFCRGIESFDFPSLVQKRISRCPRLENLVSTDWSRDDIHLLCKSENKVQKKMELKLQGNITLRRNKIQECVEYYMTSEGDGSRSLDLGVANNMRCLTFTEFSMGTKLMNMMTIATVFPLLEVMCLVNITELEEIWDIDGPKNLNELRLKSLPALKHLWQIRSSPSQMNVDVSIFNKLSCIYIYGCHKLRNLFPLSMMGRGSCLLQLERLEIENCEMMEQVFLWNGENIHIEKFPKLKFLSLSFLPNLRNICKGIERIQCPQLDKMKIINCPRLESLVYWDKELTFIFNSLRSSQLERGKGANTALQPHMFKREEKRQQQQKEVEEEQRPPTQGGRQCEIEEELES